MNKMIWLRIACLLILAQGAPAAFAQTPTITRPQANEEIRGDEPGGYELRWTTSQPPALFYLLEIESLDPANPNNVIATNNVPIDLDTVQSRGGNQYSTRINFNQSRLDNLGTGNFRLRLRAVGPFNALSGPVTIFKGRVVIQENTGNLPNGNDPSNLIFTTDPIDDPDNSGDWRYDIRFVKIVDGQRTATVFGPFFKVVAAEQTITRPDIIPGNTENLLDQGFDYDMEIRVKDTVNNETSETKGLTSFVVIKRFHFNFRPVIDQLTGPAKALYLDEAQREQTTVPFAVEATDTDHTTVTFTLHRSLRTDATFATPHGSALGSAFVMTATVTRSPDGKFRHVFNVPIPYATADTPYWQMRAFVRDTHVQSLGTLSANLTMNDRPIVREINPRYASNNIETPDHRYDFDLTFRNQDVVPNVVDGQMKFDAVVTDKFFATHTYNWTFGDGGSSTQQAPSHTYTAAAAYMAELVVTDAMGDSNVRHEGAPLQPTTINDRPVVKITGVLPGSYDAGEDAFFTALNSAAGAQVDILWKRYNFVRSGDETLQFSWDRTGNTIVCDRRGVANVETPTPGNVFFNPTNTPIEVPDQSQIVSVANVPVGERLGPIVGVSLHNINLQQIFNKPAANNAADAPTITNGLTAVNAAGATSDGFADIDLISVTAATDTCADPPLLVPGAFNVATGLALADGSSDCDIETAVATDSCTSPALIGPGTQSVNTAAATADGFASCDLTVTGGADNSASAVPVAPGIFDINLTLASADGISTCDILDVIEADLCALALPIAPGSFPVSTVGALADGFSTADQVAVSGTDLCAVAPSIAPGTFTANTTGGLADGFSSVDNGDPGAADDPTLAPFVAPGTFLFDTSAASGEGSSSSDFLNIAGTDDCADADRISPGILAVDTTTATADGFADCDLIAALAADLCANATPIAPGLTYTVDLSAAGGEGTSSSDTSIVNASDTCADSELIDFDVLYSGATGPTLDGISNADALTTGTWTDAFYTLVPRSSGLINVLVDLGPTTGSVLSIHSDCPATTATEISSGFNATPSSNTFFMADAGTTYTLRVARPDLTPSFTIQAFQGTARKDRYFSYTPRADGNATFALSGSPAGAVLSIHSACDASTGNEIDSAATMGTTQAEVTIPVTAGTTYLVRVASALNDSDETFDFTVDGPGVRNDVWYEYRPKANGTLTLALSGSAAGAVLSVHSACPGTAANEIDCSLTTSGQAALTLPVVKNTNYQIRVAADPNGATPAFNLNVNGPSARKDRWLRYIPRANGTATVTLSGSAPDTIVSAHTALPATPGNEIASDTTTGGDQASISFPVTAGTTYWIRGAGPIDESDEVFNLTLDGPGVRRDIYYAYTPRANGTLNVAFTDSPNDAVLSVHSACPAGIANELAAAITTGTTQAAVSIPVTANTAYIIRVAGPKNLSDQIFDMTVSGPGVRRDVYFTYTPQANGAASFAISQTTAGAVLSIHTGGCPVTAANQVASTRTTTTGATINLNVVKDTQYIIRIAEPMNGSDQSAVFTLAGPNSRRDVWLAYTPRASGLLDLALIGSPDDALISLHGARPGTAANTLACDRTDTSEASIDSFPVVADTTYYIRIAGDMIVSDNTFSLSLAGPGVRRDVWYRYVPRASGPATVSLVGSPVDAVVSVHSGCPGTIANEIDCGITGGSQATASFNAVAGTSYYIRVGGPKNAGVQAFSLNLAGPGVRKDVFYRYTPVSSGTATFTLAGTTNDAILSIHNGCPATAANDLNCTRTLGNVAVLSRNVTAGTDYIIRVAGPKDANGENFTLNVAGPNTRNDVWFAYEPGASGQATVALSGSSNRSLISVHTAAPGTPANDVAGGVTTTGGQGQATFNAVQGQTYFIRMAVPFGGTTAFNVNLNGPAPAEWIADLTIRLRGPDNTEITLVDGMCKTPNPLPGVFNLDEPAQFDIQTACPPAANGTYEPIETLTVFNNKLATGNWTLTVTDNAQRNVGRLQGWALQICTREVVPAYNGTVNNGELFSEIAGGVIPHLYKVSGIYEFEINPPVEHFGSASVVGLGDEATIIVEDVATRNSANGWLFYE